MIVSTDFDSLITSDSFELQEDAANTNGKRAHYWQRFARICARFGIDPSECNLYEKDFDSISYEIEEGDDYTFLMTMLHRAGEIEVALDMATVRRLLLQLLIASEQIVVSPACYSSTPASLQYDPII